MTQLKYITRGVTVKHSPRDILVTPPLPMPDFTTIIGYLSGIYLIDPKLEASSLLPTLIAVHIFDGILCLIIARHSRRKVAPWGLVGLTVGVWAVLPLLLLPAKNRDQGSRVRDQQAEIRGQGSGVRDQE